MGNAKRDADQDTSFERECLQLVFRILTEGGLPVVRLRKVANDELAALRDSRRSWNAADLAYFQHLAHVLTLWHSLAGYVDAFGVPRKLRLSARGNRPSLSGLIQRVFPRQNPAAVLATLRRVGAVRRSGPFWLPRGRRLVFKSPHIARLSMLNELRNFLRTSDFNLTHREKLIQQSAFNPAVPVRVLRNVGVREREDADQFLILRDADLTREQQASWAGESVVGTGVGVYAYRDTTLSATGTPDVFRRSEHKKKRTR